MSSFSKISKEDWVQQLEKELLPKSIADFSKEVLHGIPQTPFAHIDDIPKRLFPATTHLVSNDWRITYKISGYSSQKINEIAHIALEYGIESLYFDLSDPNFTDSISDLLKGIHLDWLESSWAVSTDQYQHLNSYIKSEYPNHQDIKSYYLFPGQNFFKFNLGLNSDENYAASVLQLKKIIHYIENTDQENQSENIAIEFLADDHFLLNLISVRSIKLILLRLFEIYGIPSSRLKIYVDVNSSNLVTDLHKNLIRSTTIAISAILAGTDFLIVQGNENDESQKLRTMSAIHLQYILREESLFHKVADPLFGSYYIESMTEKFCEKIWDEIIQ